jgi:hypothetical protein
LRYISCVRSCGGGGCVEEVAESEYFICGEGCGGLWNGWKLGWRRGVYGRRHHMVWNGVGW